MSRILYFECLSGISGDMTIGSLLDLGADPKVFESELNKLNLEGYHIEINKKSKNGIFGTKFDVVLDSDHTHEHNHGHEHDHAHEKGHSHDHDHSDKDHTHTKDHSHGHNHSAKEHTHSHENQRNYGAIKELIEASTLNAKIKKMSIEIFDEVAKAESKIHNVSIDEVHFHEVGAVDSIVDIVGTAILIDMLDVDEIYASPVHVGTGFVKCAHGKIPVPAPATLEILKNIPIYSKGIRSELVTPTGAAIIKVLAKDFIDRPEMVIETIGYGIATKDLEIANLLRVNLAKKKKTVNDEKWIIECNIDDMHGEIYSYIMDKLLNEGALDVTYSTIQMKKNRPGVKITILCHGKDLENLENIMLLETSTFGVRHFPVQRKILERSYKKVTTPLGELTFKYGYIDEKCVKITPEYEELKDISLTQDMPLINVYQIINSFIEKELLL